MKTIEKIYKKVEPFFFKPQNDLKQAFFRISVALLSFVSLLSMRSDWVDLYGKNGYIRQEIMDLYRQIYYFLPTLSQITNFLENFGIQEITGISLVFNFYLLMCVCLILGLGFRVTAIIVWFLNIIIFRSAPVYMYGFDFFMQSALFYLAFLCNPTKYSLDALLTRKTYNGSVFPMRVVQLHLCIIYFFCGLSKSLGENWWNGQAIWISIHTTSIDLLPFWYETPAWIFTLIGGLTVILEITYPIFIFWKKTRLIWLVGIVSMHIGIGYFLQLYYFSAIMITLNLFGFAGLNKTFSYNILTLKTKQSL